MRTKESVYGKGKIQNGAACGHCLEVTFRCHHKYLARIKIELDSVEKIHRIRLRVVQYLLDCGEPAIQFILAILCLLAAVLVFPMGGEPLFGNFIHAAGAYLELYPSPTL